MIRLSEKLYHLRENMNQLAEEGESCSGKDLESAYTLVGASEYVWDLCGEPQEVIQRYRGQLVGLSYLKTLKQTNQTWIEIVGDEIKTDTFRNLCKS